MPGYRCGRGARPHRAQRIATTNEGRTQASAGDVGPGREQILTTLAAGNQAIQREARQATVPGSTGVIALAQAPGLPALPWAASKRSSTAS
jgi:hypothetical protein